MWRGSYKGEVVMWYITCTCGNFSVEYRYSFSFRLVQKVFLKSIKIHASYSPKRFMDDGVCI